MPLQSNKEKSHTSKSQDFNNNTFLNAGKMNIRYILSKLLPILETAIVELEEVKEHKSSQRLKQMRSEVDIIMGALPKMQAP